MPMQGKMPLRRMMIVCAVFVSVNALRASAATPARSVTLSLAAFRYGGGVTVTGSEPTFTLYVPVFRTAQRFEVNAVVRLPSNVSPRARVELLAGGVPLASELAGTRRQIELHGAFPAPHDRSAVEITIRGRLTIDQADCEPSEARSLYLFVAPQTNVVAIESAAPPQTVAGFFEGYASRFAVVADDKASPAIRLDRLALGYAIHRVVRWRAPQITLTQHPAAGDRRIIVGDYGDALRVRNGELFASPSGIDAIAAGRAHLAIGAAAELARENATPGPKRALTLDSLGIGTRTITGTGDLAFGVDSTLSIFHGRPSALHFIIELTHGALEAGDTARLDVLASGTILNSFTLARAGGRERFDVPIDDRFVRAAQNMVVRVTYLPHGQTCGAAAKTITVSLLGSSHFTWSNALDIAPSVGDFFDTAFGTLDVGVEDARFESATFALLDKLGTINSRVRRVAVRSLDAAPDAAADAVVEAGTAARLRERLPIAVHDGSDGYSVSDGGGTIVFRTGASDSFALLQTFSAVPPTLALTFAGDASVLGALAPLSPNIFTQAGNDVLIFNDRNVAYTRTAEIARARTLPQPFYARTLPLFGAAAVILGALLLVIVRRARNVS
jgi:hypothetical protein